MKYIENGDTITLEMSFDDYSLLLIMLGAATGLAHQRGDEVRFWRWIDFVNRMNAGNPNFTPYDIPDEYRTRADV